MTSGGGMTERDRYQRGLRVAKDQVLGELSIAGGEALSPRTLSNKTGLSVLWVRRALWNLAQEDKIVFSRGFHAEIKQGQVAGVPSRG